jgi:hypothetical protein
MATRQRRRRTPMNFKHMDDEVFEHLKEAIRTAVANLQKGQRVSVIVKILDYGEPDPH